MLDFMNPNRAKPTRLRTYYGDENDPLAVIDDVPFDIEAGIFATQLAEWDPAKHPRDPKGVSTGGRFAFGPDRTPAESPRDLAREGSRKLWDNYHSGESFNKDENARIVSTRMLDILGERLDPETAALRKLCEALGVSYPDDPTAAWQFIDTAQSNWDKKPGDDAGFREQMKECAERRQGELDKFLESGSHNSQLVDQLRSDVNVGKKLAEVGLEPLAEWFAASSVHSFEQGTYADLLWDVDNMVTKDRERFLSQLRVHGKYLGWTDDQMVKAWNNRFHDPDGKVTATEAYGIASCLTHSWAISSHSPEALLVQESASRLFDTPADAMDGYLTQPLSKIVERQLASYHKGIGSDDIFRLTEAKVDAYVQACYEETQKFLAAENTEWMLLHRGSTGAYDLNALENGHVSLQSSPLTSWTTSGSTAADGWGDHSDSINVELVVSQNVHASRILSVSRTGPGCTSEYEVVVIGSGRQPSRVVRARIKPDLRDSNGSRRAWLMDFSPETNKTAKPIFYDGTIIEREGGNSYNFSMNPFKDIPHQAAWTEGKVTFKEMTNKISELTNVPPTPPPPNPFTSGTPEYDHISKVLEMLAKDGGFTFSPNDIGLIDKGIKEHANWANWDAKHWGEWINSGGKHKPPEKKPTKMEAAAAMWKDMTDGLDVGAVGKVLETLEYDITPEQAKWIHETLVADPSAADWPAHGWDEEFKHAAAGVPAVNTPSPEIEPEGVITKKDLIHKYLEDPKSTGGAIPKAHETSKLMAVDLANKMVHAGVPKSEVKFAHLTKMAKLLENEPELATNMPPHEWAKFLGLAVIPPEFKKVKP